MITKIASVASGTSIGFRLVLTGLVLLAAAAGGGWLMANYKNVEIAELERERAEENDRSTRAASKTLQAAVLRGDALSARVAAVESASQAQLEENNHAVRRLTSGRPCLDSAAVRLLNDATGIRGTAVPATAGRSAESVAAFASDTDVGLWAASARRQYDTCRGRLAAVADFFEVTPSE
ncbi:MAG: hypothetical protein ABTQ26_08880 [Azonexus sp.]